MAIFLLRHDSIDVNLINKSGKRPIHLAARDAKLRDLISIMIERGTSVDASDVQGAGALHVASRNGNVNGVKLLLACGAQVG